MEKALEILQHIEKLYAKDYDDSYATKLSSKNPDMVNAWNESFKNYDLLDVLAAIDDFWQFKNSKSRPNVAQIAAILTSKNVDTSDNTASGLRTRILKCADEMGDKWGYAARERYLKVARQQFPGVDLSDHSYTPPVIIEMDKIATETDFASKFMNDDIKRGSCRHILNIYNRAVRYIAEGMLSKQISFQEYSKMDFRNRCEKALKMGLFNHIDEVLIKICREIYNKDYQF